MLRPLRLKRFDDQQAEPAQHPEEGTSRSMDEARDPQQKDTALTQLTQPAQQHASTLAEKLLPLTPPLEAAEAVPLGEEGARSLLKRTPSSYLLNQAYGFWVFISLFILTLIITRKVSVEQYGVYGVATAAFNTIAYIVAFGLEDATTTFVPRVLAEHGLGSAAHLIRRLFFMRLLTLGVALVVMLFGMPSLATLIDAIPLAPAHLAAVGLRDPGLLSHIAPIAFFVFANGIVGLMTSVYAAVMRMRIVFIMGSLAQLLLLVLGFVTLQLGWGIDSILWLQGICTFLNVLAFAIWQAPLIFARGSTYAQPLWPVVRLGLSAWFTNLVSGALLKQVSIILLGAFSVSLVQIAFFNLSFQLAHAASLLLVSGFGGVGGSALAAAFVGMNYERLARCWQTLVKIETLLSAPGLVFCLFNAQSVVLALYGSNFAPVGPLFAIFLFFNIIVRVLGTTIHQSTLYVVRKPRLVVLAQWVGLLVVVILDILFIPRWGPAGALVGDGISQLVTGGLLLAFLWSDLPEKYPLGFTLRILLAVSLAALPGLVFHPSSRILVFAFALVFIVLMAIFLLVIKPLSKQDLAMIAEFRASLVPYIRWFSRA